MNSDAMSMATQSVMAPTALQAGAATDGDFVGETTGSDSMMRSYSLVAKTSLGRLRDLSSGCSKAQPPHSAQERDRLSNRSSDGGRSPCYSQHHALMHLPSRTFFKITLGALGLVAILHAASLATPDQPGMSTSAKHVKIKTGEQVLTATLEDHPNTTAFVALLPLELTLADYNRTEKISDLPNKLSTADAPAGITPTTGDITYYAPRGNLAIFYRDFSYSRGLVKLGRMDSGTDLLRGTGPIKVRIEMAKYD
jgi:hypothetical protein